MSMNEVHRIWRRARPILAMAPDRKKVKGSRQNSSQLRKAIHTNELWCHDFIMARTDDGFGSKCFVILDQHS